jgi:hypothetical protein
MEIGFQEVISHFKLGLSQFKLGLQPEEQGLGIASLLGSTNEMRRGKSSEEGEVVQVEFEESSGVVWHVVGDFGEGKVVQVEIEESSGVSWDVVGDSGEGRNPVMRRGQS